MELGEEKGAGKSGGTFWLPPQVTPSRKAERGNGLGVLTDGANLYLRRHLWRRIANKTPLVKHFTGACLAPRLILCKFQLMVSSCATGEMYK